MYNVFSLYADVISIIIIIVLLIYDKRIDENDFVLKTFRSNTISVCFNIKIPCRCLQDIAINCNGGRERRDVSSEVVNNILTTARPINNFLQMVAEILGDEGMYVYLK